MTAALPKLAIVGLAAALSAQDAAPVKAPQGAPGPAPAPASVPASPAAPAKPAAAPAFPPPGDATPKKPSYPQKSYDCTFTKTPIKMDGKLDDPAWMLARWSDDFVDIQGPELAAPRHRTRMKMLWDDTYLYIAALMEEPHVWASLKNHDDIVFRDNDFEVFIDPDGDAREYYELEVNAFGTIFDLYLHRRYKEDGPAEHGWNCEGLKTAIHINGTLNDPTDRDTGWSLEWAIPWSSLKPPAWDRPGFGEKERGAAAPKPGEEWRINFSRVQWLHNWEGKTAPKPIVPPINDHYDQQPPKPGADDGRPKYEKTPNKPEDNWVWTPQWQIDMHDPRWWGRVKFVR
jgi:hypothetical protein